ncbi:hypothetical protein HR060_06215 [Catenovulum sp. SM1970]|uniref:hypothetical protein n=1 Tax=Marinifaba aquimaris TaxID=2741323 RepID=UPI001571B244|nr:hypothetical protein [Marinifaba aquimaris]NTS76460.1 hypothetical protein [Marinifaba aquimaris]
MADNMVNSTHNIIVNELAGLGLINELNRDFVQQPDDLAQLLEMMMLDDSLSNKLRFQLANYLHCIQVH